MHIQYDWDNHKARATEWVDTFIFVAYQDEVKVPYELIVGKGTLNFNPTVASNQRLFFFWENFFKDTKNAAEVQTSEGATLQQENFGELNGTPETILLRTGNLNAVWTISQFEHHDKRNFNNLEMLKCVPKELTINRFTTNTRVYLTFIPASFLKKN